MSIDQHLSRLRADHRSRNYSPLGPASGTSQNSANATANNIPYDAKALAPNSRNVKLEGYGYNRAQHVPSRTAATVQRRSNMPNVSFESMPPPPPRPRPPARIDVPMSSSPPPPPPPPPPPEVLAAAQLGLKASELRLPGNRRHVPPKKMSARKHLARQRVVPSVLLDSQGPFMKHVQETLSTQTRLVKKRLSTINRRNDLKMQMPFYLAAQQAFTELIENALPAIEGSNLPPEIKSQLSQAWDRSNGLSKTIEQWQQLLEDDENDDLLKLESRCLTQEVELSKLLQDFDPHVSVDREGYLSEVSETLFPTNSRPPSTTSEHESIDSTTSVRQRYLRTIGTMNLLRDRIFNWESDLQLQSLQREQEREDGVVLEQTDEEFFAEFDERRREIVDEYWQTKVEMAETYQACRDEGLEVQQASLPPYLDQLFSLDSSKDIASTGKEDSLGLSESSRNIMHWAHHVQRMSQPESLALLNQVLTEKDAEDLLPFPQYQNLQASTDLHGPTGSVSGSRSVQRPPSRDFEGEIPTARRRYSAPMLIQGTNQSDDLQALDFQDANTRRMMGRRRESRSGLRRVKSEL